MAIREIIRQDIEGLKIVVGSSGLFPPDSLEEMISEYLESSDSEEIWLTNIDNGRHVAIAYCAPEKFTEGTYNLYAIGVLQERRGEGIGRAMIGHVEEILKKKSARVLIVETSSDDQFILTQKFYKQLGYHHEATIRDFWQEGENKEVFWKKLD